MIVICLNTVVSFQVTNDNPRSPHDVMAEMFDYSLEVSEFELQSFCYIHFQTYESYEPLLSPSILILRYSLPIIPLNKRL